MLSIDSVNLVLIKYMKFLDSYIIVLFIRSYWDPVFDEEVMSNRVALQLLYVQVRQEEMSN